MRRLEINGEAEDYPHKHTPLRTHTVPFLTYYILHCLLLCPFLTVSPKQATYDMV